MEFLSGLLPVTGCAVLDDRGNVQSSWGNLPAVPSHKPELGAWLIELPALWISIGRTGSPWQLGFTWGGDRPPDSPALGLLSNLGNAFAGGDERTPRTPVEAMQARIQQVQAATDRLQVMRRFRSS